MGITDFYFLTVSDARYHVKDRGGRSLVHRISGARDADWSDPLLQNGALVGISRLFVCVFNLVDGYGRDFERMGYTQLGDRTDPPVAFFLTIPDFAECASSRNRLPYDPRYREQTCSTLREIGLAHPNFVIGPTVIAQFSLAQTA